MHPAFSDLKNPSKKHKDWYSPQYIKIMCKVLNDQGCPINVKAIQKNFDQHYEKVELKDRLKLIANNLEEHIDTNFESKLKYFKKFMGPKLDSEEGMFTQGFYLYPFAQYVELYADNNLDKSLSFIKELTQRFTGEWAIRSVIEHDPKLALKTAKIWMKDDNFHVRRLASEGFRPKLPWAKKIDWINASFAKLLPIYNHLRKDPILYVRRSVANTMGDWIKVDEENAYACLSQWMTKKNTQESLWVIKHAIRTPLKNKVKRYTKLDNDIKNMLKDL